MYKSAHLIVRHDDDTPVAFGPAQGSQAYSCAPGRAFYNGPSYSQLPGRLGLVDHARGDSVLARTPRVEVLYLFKHSYTIRQEVEYRQVGQVH